MALEINNAQFNQFVQFAEQQMQAGKSRAVARVGDAQTGPLAGRTITAAKGEFVGNIWRSVDTRNANDIARDLFRNAIADMFHGESNIPMSVLDAMKLADFGNGKPLTARRIIAVKTAVEQFAGAAGGNADAAGGIDERIKAGIENSLSKIMKKKQDLAAQPIRAAFEACNRDPDAVDILQKNLTSRFLYTGQSDFRTEEQIRKVVGDLVSNLEELRSAAKGDPAIFAAGKDMLMNYGKTLPRGAIAKMVEATEAIPIGDLKKLSASSSAKNIHKAIADLVGNLDDAMASCGADKHLEGAEEMSPVRAFLTGALLSRCDQVTLRNIHDALHSDTAGQLRQFYGECCSENQPHMEGQSEDIRNGVADVAVGCDYGLKILNSEINANIARMDPSWKPSPLPDAEGEANMKAIGGKEIVKAMIESASASNAQKVENHVNATVKGSGQGAEIVKDVLRKKLDGANKPEERLGKRLDANANAMMNWTVCGEMKKLAADGGKTSQFAKDISRRTNATLADGKTTFKLSNDFETARNELARFVTGDPNAIYGGLKSAEDRNKVHLLMALLSQETEKAGEDGMELAVSSREEKPAFQLWHPYEGASRSFTIEKKEDGGISLHYVVDNPITDIKGDAMDDTVSVGEGSKLTSKVDYTLKGVEFYRLAKLDFGKFDGQEGDRVFNRMVDMPDGTKQFPENKLQKTVDTFAEEFKINAECRLDFSMILEPSDEEQILQNSQLQGGNVIFMP